MNEQKKSKHKFVNVNGYLKVIEIKPTVKTKDIFEGYKDEKKKKLKRNVRKVIKFVNVQKE